MARSTALPNTQRVVRTHHVVTSVATAASGIMRQMAIKRFTPRMRRREFFVQEKLASYLAVRNHIFKEKGTGNIPTIVIGGFVPDATEAVEFQRSLFRSYGSIYYMNYSRSGFSTEMFYAQLADLIEDINRRGKAPVIFAVSFGCGLLVQALKGIEKDTTLSVRGVVLVSPVLCTEDLTRSEREKGGGVRMLESNLRRIFKADATKSEEVGRQIDRARRCFQSLFEAGAENRELTSRHLSIRRKIMDVLGNTTAVGGYERVLALKQFAALEYGQPLFSGAALALMAEAEDDILVPSSPTLNALRAPVARKELFPRGTFRTVASSSADDPVAHASLIFHHHCYNPLIEAWYGKLVEPRFLAVV